MSRDHNDIYSIVDRLRVLEEGLDKNQRSVNQLSATFKPKTVAVLTAKRDPKNPMAGKLVGGAEESTTKDQAVLEAEMAEDVLEKVKNSFKDFIKSVESEIKDSDIKDKKHEDTDIKEKKREDRDLVSKAVKEDPTEEEPVIAEPPVVAPQTPIKNPTYAESAPVKTVTMEDGNLFEIHGNEHDGFEIRRGQRSMPSRFKNLDQAQMALEMFAHRLRKQNESQDYIDEA
jgi:hypothetical protein